MPQLEQTADEYKIINPFNVEHDSSETVVVRTEDNNSNKYYVFYSSEWDVEIIVAAKRKLKEPTIGSRWKYLGAEGKLILEVLGNVKQNGQIYVATRDEDNKDNLFLDEISNFREQHKEITG